MSTAYLERSQPSDDRARGGAAGAPLAAKPARRLVLAFATRLLNPMIVKLVGKRHVRAYAVIEHRGRRSGRTYTTPVAARPTADGFVVPMAFSEQADWFRNVLAAGECVIRWNGVAYHVVEPELIDSATARQALGRVERMLAPLFSKQFVRLRLAPSRAAPNEIGPPRAVFPQEVAEGGVV
jgi:deazaflavin-dependent oxidoreductase (nitroreductase family)